MSEYTGAVRTEDVESAGAEEAVVVVMLDAASAASASFLASLYATSTSAAVDVSHFDKITAETPSRMMHEHLTSVLSSDGSVVNAKKIDL